MVDRIRDLIGMAIIGLMGCGFAFGAAFLYAFAAQVEGWPSWPAPIFGVLILAAFARMAWLTRERRVDQIGAYAAELGLPRSVVKAQLGDWMDEGRVVLTDGRYQMAGGDA